MAKCRKLSAAGVILSLLLTMLADITVHASAGGYLDDMRGGVASLLGPGIADTDPTLYVSVREFGAASRQGEELTSNLVMTNVKKVLNVRSEASEKAEKVGRLYKDCGGIVLERKDGWTKLQSGNIIGWASDEFLLFDEEARSLANDVGKMIATVDRETLRVRMEPNTEADVYGLLPKGEMVEVISGDEASGWICVDYNGNDGYISAEYVKLDFIIGAGETIAEIKAREAAELEARRHVNYGQYTTSADMMLLLAALIQCEAGGEPYEGQVAVGAVVMNRVRSPAYPDSIHGVIYAPGQFTPALSGRLNKLYESGRISASCIQAAQEAISGVSNVGDMTHFRRVNGREGLVIGRHVFY